MEVEFKINDFEGPLDLLLHLIKESKMDIMNIEIVSITKQYFDFLNEQEKMNLEISSEYLVLASELLEIKSRMLLPNSKSEDEEDEELDPREELVNRLLEYQAYKDITKLLHEKEELRRDIYTKSPENIKNYIDETQEIKVDVSLDDLISAFQKYYQRKIESKPLKTKRRVSFFELFPVVSKEYVVATFLAVLEMAKEKEITITQKDTFDDIICEVI